ncbi:hypothetical protein [Ruegeria sp. HKCCD7221]|uniref:hypothetical protein n=1 Tax=Ruegeria sp. HKCCD7221 TaxID=2683009 RepID=UPI0014892FED|nr:hypothetical protein [Ruegeria sp. HKCCD7221]
MTDLTEMVWDTDIDRVLNRIQPRSCADPDHFYATVDLIENGWSPTGDGRLTMSQLEAWDARVKTERTTNAQDPTRGDVPTNNDVPHGATRENHWHLRQIHPPPSRSAN